MTAKTNTPPAASTALEVEQQCAIEMERGRRLGAEAAGEAARAAQDVARAEADRSAALEAEIIGADDAHERLTAALQAMHDARERKVLAEERVAAGRRVYEAAQARQRQVRIACADELAQDAEALVAAAVEARDALREPLGRYVLAYRAAEKRWRDLYAGGVAAVEAVDAARGYWRDPNKVDREASCPPCPLPAEVVAQVLGTVPQPPVFRAGFQPDAPAETYSVEVEPTGPQPLFPGDAGHQQHARDLGEAADVLPNGATPAPSRQQLQQWAAERAARQQAAGQGF